MWIRVYILMITRHVHLETTCKMGKICNMTWPYSVHIHPKEDVMLVVWDA